MTRFPNTYPADWTALSFAVREAARFRCVQCRHPFDAAGRVLPCDNLCDERRGRTWRDETPGLTAHNWQKPGLNYGVHHLDGDKANGVWWNLLALCNSCHLTIQSRVIIERPYILAHSEWFIPYVAGFYASYFGKVHVTRDEVMADPALFLAMGQPQLYEAAR